MTSVLQKYSEQDIVVKNQLYVGCLKKEYGASFGSCFTPHLQSAPPSLAAPQYCVLYPHPRLLATIAVFGSSSWITILVIAGHVLRRRALRAARRLVAADEAASDRLWSGLVTAGPGRRSALARCVWWLAPVAYVRASLILLTAGGDVHGELLRALRCRSCLCRRSIPTNAIRLRQRKCAR